MTLPFTGMTGADALAVTSVASLVFVSSITPGPNNTMVIASGARFGFGPTVPHMLGITTGVLLQILLCALGVGALLLSYPRLQTVMAVACTVYLLWLAWRIATQKSPTADAAAPEARRPMRWHAAVAFQFVNPKAWGMSLALSSMIAAAHLDNPPALAALLALTAVINLACVCVWASLGSSARHLLQDPKNFRTFNVSMAVLLATSAAMTLDGVF